MSQPALVSIMAWPLVGTKPSSELILIYRQLVHKEQYSVRIFHQKFNIFIQENAFESVICKMAAICLGLNLVIMIWIQGYALVGNGWFHDDVIKWKHFPRNWPFVRGIPRSPVNSPHKGQWRGAMMLSSICAWIYGWINNREAGDLRRHRAHYDVTVMQFSEIKY